MPKRRPPPFRNSSSAEGATDPDLPSLLELERFTTASLHQWITAATRMEALHRALYFGLETLRQRDGSRLIDAVRSCTHNDYCIDHWSRIVDYCYSLGYRNLGYVVDAVPLSARELPTRTRVVPSDG